MASKLLTIIFLLLFPTLVFVGIPAAAQETSHKNNLRNIKISSHLSSKSYTAMALILEQALSPLIPNSQRLLIPDHATVTIFCPSNKAIFSSKYLQPPLTLLQYHIAPSKIDREALESSTRFESKIDTLLSGHPLVVTTQPHGGKASINGVKITDWNIYSDENITVHGVEDLFDPSFQTLLYPRYDSGELYASKVRDRMEDTRMFLKAVLGIVGVCVLLQFVYVTRLLKSYAEFYVMGQLMFWYERLR